MKIILTGANGWIGRTILNELQKKFSPTNFNDKVIAFGSKNGLIKSTFYSINDEIDIPIIPLEKAAEVISKNEKLNIIHTAFLTQDKLSIYGTKEFIRINSNITQTILNLLNNSRHSRIVCFSSGAAKYYDNKVISSGIKSNIYGYLKKEEEKIIEKNANEYLILRVYGLTGKYIRDHRKFALGDFLNSASNGKIIKISSKRSIIRGYVNATDISKLAIKWLHDKKTFTSERIDALNVTTDIVNLARLISIKYSLPDPEFNIDKTLEEDNYTANKDRFVYLLKSYNIKPKNLDEQINDTYESFK